MIFLSNNSAVVGWLVHVVRGWYVIDSNVSFDDKNFSSAASNEPRRGNGVSSLTGLIRGGCYKWIDEWEFS